MGFGWQLLLYLVVGGAVVCLTLWLVEDLVHVCVALGPVVALFFGIYALYAHHLGVESDQEMTIVRDGALAHGTVVDLHASLFDVSAPGLPGEPNDPDYTIYLSCVYGFDVDGRHFTGVTAVNDSDVFERLRVGQPLDVRYLPGDPARSQPVGPLAPVPSGRLYTGAWVMAIIAAVFYLGTVATALVELMPPLRSARRPRGR